MNSLKFKQSHYYSDVRLALGYAAVIISGVLFYADWKLGWDATKAYTLPAVLAYFVLNGAFTYWLFWVEKGKIYIGEKDGTKACDSPSLVCEEKLTETDCHIIILRQARAHLQARGPLHHLEYAMEDPRDFLAFHEMVLGGWIPCPKTASTMARDEHSDCWQS